MLINELILRNLDPKGSVHERGIRVNPAQIPPGVRVHSDGDEAVVPVAGDLLLVRAPVGLGLREHIDADLPIGVALVLLLETEVTDLPVGRVLAALAVAKLQVVEAAVVSGTTVATVAVVAMRTDVLVAPLPYLAHDVEPGDHSTLAVLQRRLAEHALDGLVQRARERDLEARLADATRELELSRADLQDREAIARERDAAREEAEVERKVAEVERERTWSLVRDRDAARDEAEGQRKLMRSLRSSRSFRLASSLANVSGQARRIIRRSGHRTGLG